ncbi:MAG: PEP-CTERM sorting domain-containing protein [Planctomycetes bacterium]|nr:PEP-CTERM sorting domain-containing protein [Planctomycetota bacterium]
MDEAFGTFGSNFTHVTRTVRVRQISTVAINIIPTEDIRITFDASVTYAHTPGDETVVTFGGGVANLTQGFPVFVENFNAGNAYSEPASDVLTIQGEAILLAGNTYRLGYTLDTDNGADFTHPPTGILDATGWANFTIAPVPEPSTVFLIAAALPLLRRRRAQRRCSHRK